MGGKSSAGVALLALGAALAVTTGGAGLAGLAAAEGAAGGVAAAGAAEGLVAGTAAMEAGAVATTAAEVATGAEVLAAGTEVASTVETGAEIVSAATTGADVAATGFAEMVPSAMSSAVEAPLGVETSAANLGTNVMESGFDTGLLHDYQGFFTENFGGPLVGAEKSGSILSYSEAGGMALSGMSAGINAMSSAANAKTQRQQMELQAKQVEAQTTARELQSQQRLRDVLAKQNLMFGEVGIDPSSGSALNLANAAAAAADSEISMANLEGGLNRQALTLGAGQSKKSKQGAYLGGVLDFGQDLWSVRSYRRRIGG